MKKSILIIVLALISSVTFAQAKKETVKQATKIPKKVTKPVVANPDSIWVSTSDFKSIIANYFNKVDKAAIADKLDVDQKAAYEKKALGEYYNKLFPEPKPAPADTIKKTPAKPIK
jgi:hypothetical protein